MAVFLLPHQSGIKLRPRPCGPQSWYHIPSVPLEKKVCRPLFHRDSCGCTSPRSALRKKELLTTLHTAFLSRSAAQPFWCVWRDRSQASTRGLMKQRGGPMSINFSLPRVTFDCENQREGGDWWEGHPGNGKREMKRDTWLPPMFSRVFPHFLF